jgi:iron complex outermembrane receptor protein
MHRRSYLAGNNCLAVFVMVLALSTLAAAATDAGPSSTDRPDSSQGLEELVVTATRRSESAQTVPITISAFQASDLARLNVTNSEDLASVTPGLTITRTLNSAQVYIRGVGNQSSAVGEEGATALYIDGVYMASQPAALLDFNNVDRIEVLKGPQGTLFGRNAAGGLINVITRQPSQDSSATVSVGYGNFGTYSADLYATTGLTKNLTADVAMLYRDESQGWGHDLTTGLPVYRDRDSGIRSKLVLDLDTTKIGLAVTYIDIWSEIGSALNAYSPGTVALLGIRPWQGFYNTTENEMGFSQESQAVGALTITHDFSAAQFVSISSYQWLAGNQLNDNDASALPLIKVTLLSGENTRTQEFQLHSVGSSALSWLGGLYYFSSNAEYKPFSVSGLAFADSIGFLDTYANLGTSSWAGFGDLTYALAEGTKLTIGTRYTKEQKEIDYTEVTGLGTAPAAHQSTGYSKVTYKATLDHQFTPDLLGFVSFNTGFKSGNYNTVAPSQPAYLPENVKAYEAGFKGEFLDHRIRLNGSVFFSDYKDIQLEEIVSAGGITLNAASSHIYGAELSAEAALIDGLRLISGLGYQHGRYTSFPDAPITTPAPPNIGGNIITAGNAAGNTMLETPLFQGSLGLAYTVKSVYGALGSSLLYSYTTSFYWDADNRIQQPAYGLVNANLTWESPNGRWKTELWGKNLTDKEYFTFGSSAANGDIGSPAAPRTYGVRFTAKF